jgi:hypothetical protein
LVPVAIHRYHGRYMTIVVGLAILVDFELHDSVSCLHKSAVRTEFVLVQSDPKRFALQGCKGMSNGSSGVPGAVKVVTVVVLPQLFRLRRDHYSRVVVRSDSRICGIMIHMHSVGLRLIACVDYCCDYYFLSIASPFVMVCICSGFVLLSAAKKRVVGVGCFSFTRLEQILYGENLAAVGNYLGSNLKFALRSVLLHCTTIQIHLDSPEPPTPAIIRCPGRKQSRPLPRCRGRSRAFVYHRTITGNSRGEAVHRGSIDQCGSFVPLVPLPETDRSLPFANSLVAPTCHE